MDLDVTLLIQMALLVVLMNTFGPWLFTPVLHVLQQRQHRIHGLAREVAQLDKMSAADRQAYTLKLQAGRREALAAREAARTRGREEARSLVNAARNEQAAAQAEVRARLKAQEMTMGAELRAAVPALAQALSDKLAGSAPTA